MPKPITVTQLAAALSLEELIAFRNELQQVIADQFGEKRDEVKVELRAMIKAYGITAEDFIKRRGPRKGKA